MKFKRIYRPPETVASLVSKLLEGDYNIESLAAWEIIRVRCRKTNEVYMAYERANGSQSWHPKLYKILVELENADEL